MLDLKPLLTAAVKNGFTPVYKVNCKTYGWVDAEFCKRCVGRYCEKEE